MNICKISELDASFLAESIVSLLESETPETKEDKIVLIEDFIQGWIKMHFIK